MASSTISPLGGTKGIRGTRGLPMAKVPKLVGTPNPSTWSKILDNLNRLGYGSNAVIQDIVEGRVDRPKFEAWWKGVTLQEKTLGTDILTAAGWDPDSRLGQIAKTVSGLGIDIAADPTTWVGTGVTNFGKLSKIFSGARKLEGGVKALKGGKYWPAIETAMAAKKKLSLGPTLAERAARRQWALITMFGHPVTTRKVDVAVAKALGVAGTWASHTAMGNFARRLFTTKTGNPRLDRLILHMERGKSYGSAAVVSDVAEIAKSGIKLSKTQIDDVVKLLDKKYRTAVATELESKVLQKATFKEMVPIAKTVVVELKKLRYALGQTVGEGWRKVLDDFLPHDPGVAKALALKGKEHIGVIIEDLLKGKRGYGKKAGLPLHRALFDAVAQQTHGVPTSEMLDKRILGLKQVRLAMDKAQDEATEDFLRQARARLESGAEVPGVQRDLVDRALNGDRTGPAGELWRQAREIAFDMPATESIADPAMQGLGNLARAIGEETRPIGIKQMGKLAETEVQSARQLRREILNSIDSVATELERSPQFEARIQETLAKIGDRMTPELATEIRGEAAKLVNAAAEEQTVIIREMLANPAVRYQRGARIANRMEASIADIRKIRGELESAVPAVEWVKQETERIVTRKMEKILVGADPNAKRMVELFSAGMKKFWEQEEALGLIKNQVESYFPHILHPDMQKLIITTVKENPVYRKVWDSYLKNSLSRKFTDLDVFTINEMLRKGDLAPEGFKAIFKDQTFIEKAMKIQPEEAEFFITNPLVAYMVRGERSVKAVAAQRFKNTVMQLERQGGFSKKILSANDDAAIRIAVAENPGCMAYLVRTDLEDLNLPAKLVHDIENGGQFTLFDPEDIKEITKLNPKAKKLTAFVMPEEVIQELNRVMPVSINRSEYREFVKISLWLNSRFKAWTLGIFPAYHLRNMMGNVWLSWLGGLKNPARYGQAWDLQKAANKWMRTGDKTALRALRYVNEATGQVMDGFEAFDAVRRYSVYNSGQYASDMAMTAMDMMKPKGFVHRIKGVPVAPILDPGSSQVIAWGQKAGSLVENNARLALFIDQWTKGANIEDAADHVAKYLFDYNNISNAMKTARQHFVPFVTWYINNVPLEIAEMVQHPGKFLWLEKARQEIMSGKRPVPDELMPEYVSENWGFQYSRKGNRVKYLLIGSWLPAGDLPRLAAAASSPENMASYIASFASPFLREPMEQLINKDLYFKTQIERYKGEKAVVGPFVMSKRSAHILRNIRLINELDRLNPGGYMTWIGVKTGALPASALTAGRPHKIELDTAEKWAKLLGVKPAIVDIEQRKRIREIEIGKNLGMLRAALSKVREGGLAQEGRDIEKAIKEQESELGVVREYR